MGIDTASAMFLCAAKSLGVDFTRTAMIGRQAFFPNAATLQRVLSILGIQQSAAEFLRESKYAEPFFSALGAQEIDSLDYSSYENASILHDMNLPIPTGLRQRFSVVYDGGTIEHVFNIPQAFRNCMEMVRVGGHFLQTNIANNYMGHGFWQFSPELIFRIFTAANGYQIEAVLLHEVVPGGAWYIVTDPDKIRSRVELCNCSPTYILTVAKRVACTEIFSHVPQQSDYATLWDKTARASLPPAEPQKVKSAPRSAAPPIGFRRYHPGSVSRAVKVILKRLALLDIDPYVKLGFDESYYRRLDEAALLRGQLTRGGPKRMIRD